MRAGSRVGRPRADVGHLVLFGAQSVLVGGKVLDERLTGDTPAEGRQIEVLDQLERVVSADDPTRLVKRARGSPALSWVRCVPLALASAAPARIAGTPP
jgi:hypothetical protein